MKPQMTLDEFCQSLTATEPPAGLTRALAGLWWGGKGDWARAHESAQQDEGVEGVSGRSLGFLHPQSQRRICGMNSKQQNAKAKLQDELKNKRGITQPLPDLGENDKGYFFTEVGGVTVLLGPRGGYLVPSLPSYPEPLDAAVHADNKWKAHNPDPSCGTGHCNPVVNIDWFCIGSRNCPCKDESPNQRFRRSVGRIGYG